MNHKNDSIFFINTIKIIGVSLCILFIANCGGTSKERAKVRSIACREQLNRIYIALNAYRNDFGAYPNEEIGLEILINRKYIRSSGNKYICCPNTEFKKYIYKPPTSNMSKIPIVYDDFGFHDNSGNILYSNGDIVEMVGDEWNKIITNLKYSVAYDVEAGKPGK